MTYEYYRYYLITVGYRIERSVNWLVFEVQILSKEESAIWLLEMLSTCSLHSLALKY